MQKFFTDFETINRFTLSLDYHQDKLECRHCLKHDQFVSHGIVYKQRSIAEVEKVGKRIFCSNRYGRSGCGRSFQLNVTTKIPRLRYGAAELFVFIASLLLNLTITEAYQKATGQFESRNAWRWLDKLMVRLSSYRTGLTCLADKLPFQFITHNRRLQHLLPTLAQLTTNADACPCSAYQFQRQNAFM
jgi:hypothetical protein